MLSMLKCSYIILISNNALTIPRLVDSLKEINGNFRCEYIFLDNRSTDDSLIVLKQNISLLPNATILSHHGVGSASNVHKAINLINGDYVHFVHGWEVLLPESTATLIGCCEQQGTEAAIGVSSNAIRSKKFSGDISFKLFPVKEVLEYSLSATRNIGLSGYVARFDLLRRIYSNYDMSYEHPMLLFLRCAKYGDFGMVDQLVSVTDDSASDASTDVAYNDLSAILHFIKTDQEWCESYKSSLLFALSYNTKPYHKKISYYLQYCLAKFFKQTSLERIIQCYEQELA
jgi:glycosyltransferase involved in cell wall biosynthesis